MKCMEDEIKCLESYDMIYDDTLREFLEETCPAHEYDVKQLIEDIKLLKLKTLSPRYLSLPCRYMPSPMML